MSDTAETPAATAEEPKETATGAVGAVAPVHPQRSRDHRVLIGVIAGLIGGLLLAGALFAVPAMLRGVAFRHRAAYTFAQRGPFYGERGERMMGQRKKPSTLRGTAGLSSQ